MIRRIITKLLGPTGWLTIEKAFGEFFALALFTIQAPMLGPAAFGLVAAAMVFVMFWEGVVASAVSEALMSVRNVEPLHYSTATTALLVGCTAFGVGVFALAEPLSRLFGSDDLVAILRFMAVLPFIQGFSVAPVIAAQRAMQFRTTTLRTTISLVAGALVGLVLTLTGAGVWALLWQAFVQRVVANMVLWYAVPIRFDLRFSRRHFRDLTPFIPAVALARVMAWSTSQFPRMILGIYMGPTKLGLFAIAQRLNTIVNLIALTPKGRVARVDLLRFVNDPEGFRNSARLTFMKLGLVTFPVSIGGAAIVPTLFHVWLDARWAEAIAPAQLLLLSCVPLVTFYGATAVLYALNLQRWDAAIATVTNAVILLALVAGGPFGLTATSAALAVAQVAPLPMPIMIMQRKCGLSQRDTLLPQARPLIAATVMGIAVSLARIGLEPRLPGFVTLIILMGLGVAVYLLLIALLMPQQSGRVVAALRHSL